MYIHIVPSHAAYINLGLEINATVGKLRFHDDFSVIHKVGQKNLRSEGVRHRPDRIHTELMLALRSS